jgi:hypothetical protein
MIPDPKTLDAQARVQVDRWVDLYSVECRDLDSGYKLAIEWFKMLEGTNLFTDSNGRIFGKGNDGTWYPFHFQAGKKLIGYRVSAKAAN